MPIDDCAPGSELQVDFGRMGIMFDPETRRRRVLWALIFTAVYSRHTFVWLSFTQSFRDGFEAAWSFFGGVFWVVIADNMRAIVDKADATNPRINDSFLEYAQARGFVIDPARARHPQDKARVERTVPYARSSFFKGENFKAAMTLSTTPRCGVCPRRACASTAPHVGVHSRCSRPRNLRISCLCPSGPRRARLVRAQGPQGLPHRGSRRPLFGAPPAHRPAGQSESRFGSG